MQACRWTKCRSSSGTSGSPRPKSMPKQASTGWPRITFAPLAAASRVEGKEPDENVKPTHIGAIAGRRRRGLYGRGSTRPGGLDGSLEANLIDRRGSEV